MFCFTLILELGRLFVRRGLDTPLFMLSCLAIGSTSFCLKSKEVGGDLISGEGNLAVNSIILENLTLCFLSLPPLSVSFSVKQMDARDIRQGEGFFCRSVRIQVKVLVFKGA